LKKGDVPDYCVNPNAMKITLLQRSKSVALTLATVVASLAAVNDASANIVAPYTADANTLHLWHLDESATPCIDSVTGSNAVNLLDLATGATLGNLSYSSGTNNFGSALNTAAGGAGKGDLLAASASAGNVTITLADPTTGAFTFEAIVQVGFDPTASLNTPYEIMACESGTTANRIFQWRIAPKGFTLIAGVTSSVPCVTFENIRAGSAGQGTIYAPIPTTGPDAIVSNGWYHVAVTYNGVPSTANNIVFYWTALNPTNVTADALTISSAVSTLSGLNPLSSITSTFMLGNQGRSKNGNFLGSIDEVRISRVARSPVQMLFSPVTIGIITQPTNQFVAVGDSPTLSVLAAGGTGITYQWRFNGANIPTGTNAALPVPNITTNQAGNYDVIVSNAQGGMTNSTVAVVTVGNLFTGLFNTGLANNGTLLAGGASDPHWTLTQSADPNYPGPSDFVISAPLGNYLTNGPNSQWITPSDGGNIAGGQFTYHTTFLLDTVDPSNSIIIGNWTSDNQGLDIQLNGVSTGITNFGAVASFTAFTITNGFVQGLNTLDCVITNLPGGGNNPSAIRVEAHGYGKFLPPTAPSIVQSPTNVTTNTQQSATFTVAAVGSAPLTYQWYGPSMTALSGQTSRTLTLNSLTTGQSGTYTVIASNSISTATASATLTVVAPPSVTWLGITSGDWDTTTTNWFNNGTLQDDLFAQFDDVIFDNNGSGQPTVNLTTALSPNSITVNAANDYTFSGVGSLDGNISLTKTNTGTLIIDATNGSSGPTTIAGGIIQIGTNDANGSFGTGPVTNNAAITLARTDTFFVPNTISGSGSVTMNGAGNAVITGNNGYTGPTVISSGTLTARNPNALGLGGTTVSNFAQLLIDLNINIANGPLVLNGTGSAGNGALHKGGGGTTIYGGTISLASASGIGVDANSTLILTNPASITSADQNLAAQMGSAGFLVVNGTVSLGAGAVQEFGTGTWTFAATNNSWTGGTTINTSTVMQIGDGGPDGSIGSGPIDVEGTLTFNSSANLTNTNTISGGGVVNDIGTGVLTLGGVNSYGGGTHVNGSAILHIGNNQALGSGTLTVGSAQTDTSRVELAGNQTIANQVAIFPRAFGTLNNPANFANLGGTNIIASPAAIQIPGGGNLLTFESDSGLLSVQSEITATGALRDLALKGAASGEITGAIDSTPGNSVLIWKLDSGTWTLSGTNLPGAGTTISNGTLVIKGSMDTNTVTVAGGTLSGTGTIGGSVVVNAGGTLSPGPGIGTMTVGNTLTLQPGSITVMDINKTLATNDQLAGLSNVVFGGMLTVNNQAGTLASGDAFALFSAGGYSGSFSTYNLPALGSGLSWDTSSLTTTGTLRVITGGNPPHISNISYSGGNLIISGSGGTPSGNYVVLASTNVAAALNTWTRVSTNAFDGTGHFSVTNAVTPGVPRTFFRLLDQ
jgi:autotransporter-associated beta strand protein